MNQPFTDAMIQVAMLKPWEECLALTGVCPKCSDSLASVAVSDGVCASKCLGCGCTFLLKLQEPT